MVSWINLQKKIEECFATSSAASSVNVPVDRLEEIKRKRINNSVYEVHRPPGRPSIELVFFHGLQPGGLEEAFFMTWLSRDGSDLWLNWILDDYSETRILLVSYDASITKTDEQGNMDMPLTCENLVQDLTEGKAQVGQEGCPVILVGHCLGGQVMKQLCLDLDSTMGEFYDPNNCAQNLCLNISDLFFYASPHHGSEFADYSKEEGELLKELTTLNKGTQRRNEAFRRLRAKREWKAYSILEGCVTKLGQQSLFFVKEASARSDVDSCYTDSKADHFTVSRHESKTSSGFCMLLDFIKRVSREWQDKKWCGPEISFQDKLGLEGQVKTVGFKLGFQNRKRSRTIKSTGPEEKVTTLMQRRQRAELRGAQRLALVGMPGIGKSTLASAVFCSIRSSFEYTCYVSDVKKIMADIKDPSYLERKIIKRLYYKGYKVHKSFRWGSMNRKMVLLVLDDVNREWQVPDTIDSGFLPGSCLIVTSRDKRFLQQKGFQCHFVSILDFDNSKRLFYDKAFIKQDPPSYFEDIAKNIIEKCAGLPLALVVVGGYLFGQKDLEVWDDILKKLRQAQDPGGDDTGELYPVMKKIYDSLQRQEKEMFLDVATCFHDKDLESVKRSWRQCGWANAMASGLINLQQKCLVTIEKARDTSMNSTQYAGSSNRSDRIVMHEVLRNLGRSLACPDGEDVTALSRVCYDVSDPLPATWPLNEENPKVKLLMISDGTSAENGYREVQMQKLQGLKKLKVLWLEGVNLTGPCDLLPHKLAYVRISNSDWSDLRSPDPSETSGNHAKLRNMDIVHCQQLEGSFNSLRSLKGLEDLRILSCVCLNAPEIIRQFMANDRIEDFNYAGDNRDKNCNPQLLQVRVESTTSSSTSASQTNSSRKVSDCSVIMQQERGYIISTRVQKDIAISTFLFSDMGVPNMVDEPIVASADTILRFRLMSYDTYKKIRIEFLQIRGELKGAGRQKSLVLTSVCTGVNAYVSNSGHPEREPIALALQGGWHPTILGEGDEGRTSFIRLVRCREDCNRMGLPLEGCNSRAVTLERKHGPVILEGKIKDCSSTSSINFDLRYQLQFSDAKPVLPAVGVPAVGDLLFIECHRVSHVVELDGALEFRTLINFNNDS